MRSTRVPIVTSVAKKTVRPIILQSLLSRGIWEGRRDLCPTNLLICCVAVEGHHVYPIHIYTSTYTEATKVPLSLRHEISESLVRCEAVLATWATSWGEHTLGTHIPSFQSPSWNTSATMGSSSPPTSSILAWEEDVAFTV